MIAALVPLLVIGGLIALVIRVVGRRTAQTGEATSITVRRFFHYALMYGVLVVVAIGVSGLLAEIIPARGIEVRRDPVVLARSLAFVIVGSPTLAGLGMWTQRLLDREPRERASFGWAFYLTASLLSALVVAGWAAFEALGWVFGFEDFDRESWARAVVWTVVWAGHWWLSIRAGHPPRLRLERLAGSAAGLIGVGTALGVALTAVLASLYDATVEAPVIVPLADGLGRGGAGVLVGGLIWWWYWHRGAVQFSRDTLWHAYVLLIGVFGGLATTVVSGTLALYTVLEWFIGDPSAATAAAQFDSVPAQAAGVIVGAGLWFYHRAVLRVAGATGRTDVDRIYDYLIAGIGLLAALGGVTTLLVAVIDTVLPAPAVELGASARNTLLAAITLLVVGGPIWWTFWSRIQGLIRKESRGEQTSPIRRVYLFVLFGIGGVAALISLLVVMFVAIEDLIEGRFGAETVRDLRIGLSIVLTVGATAGYHWSVFGRDREVEPEEPPGVRSVVLVDRNGAALAAAISDQFGARVRQWHRLDDHAPVIDPDAVLRALAEERYPHVLVLSGPGGVEIVPFEED